MASSQDASGTGSVATHSTNATSPSRDGTDDSLSTNASQTKRTRVFQQATHRGDFKRISMAGVDMEETFLGAQEVVCNLNPEYYSLPLDVSRL